jgi:hypothetical protein
MTTAKTTTRTMMMFLVVLDLGAGVLATGLRWSVSLLIVAARGIHDPTFHGKILRGSRSILLTLPMTPCGSLSLPVLIISSRGYFPQSGRLMPLEEEQVEHGIPYRQN